LDEKTKSVDAFSCWRNNEPYIFLNNFKTAERSRFDAAHELGHLVLHRHGGPDQRNAENEANTFASSFLMPRADVLSRASHVNTLGDIIKLKRRWRVSTAALMYRLHKLGYISDWNYRTFNIQLRQAFGDKEPEGIEREKSHVWVALLRELWKDGKTLDYIASALDLPATEVRGITFGLTAAFDSPEASRRGGLTLVK
jgi:Zn-dependent peptidase ImmA (M78 family)